ncbi:MAG TPA: hypothetical protein VFE34_11950 [Dongiaceae bacterium]|nr:hypothetical protein [Dongiaceae bacterium]
MLWSVNEGGIATEPSTTLPDTEKALFRDYHHCLDAFVSQQLIPDAWLCSDEMPDHAFHETEFYVDHGRRIGTYDAAISCFFIEHNHLGCINIMRPHDANPFDQLERSRLERLLPHLLRAFRIKSRLDMHGRSGIGFAALDALAFGMLVCDRDAHVIFANQAAEMLTQMSDAFRLRGRHEISLHGHKDRKLRALILDAAQGGAGGGLRLTAIDDTDLLILVAPLPQRLATNEATKGLALVAICAADDQLRLTAATVGTMFGLTPAEADLAFALFSGLSLADFMAERRVTESTARTQLTHVLQKTDCRNQRELVSLIGRLPQLR